jgi:hypothetical protein
LTGLSGSQKGTFFEVGPLAPLDFVELPRRLPFGSRIAELLKRLPWGADAPTERIYRYLAQAPEDPEQPQSASSGN